MISDNSNKNIIIKSIVISDNSHNNDNDNNKW